MEKVKGFLKEKTYIVRVTGKSGNLKQESRSQEKKNE